MNSDNFLQDLSDANNRHDFLLSPKGFIEKRYNRTYDSDVIINAKENTKDIFYFVIPQNPVSLSASEVNDVMAGVKTSTAGSVSTVGSFGTFGTATTSLSTAASIASLGSVGSART